MIKLKNLLMPLMVILFLAFTLTANCTVTLMQTEVENIKYLGLSSDDKPTTNIPSGSLFFETDTLREYIFDLTSWNLYKYEGESGFDITEHPIVGQGTSDGVQWGDEVSSGAAVTDVELLLYESETYYPYTEGYLTEVYYEISFSIKAANVTADIIYQLQAQDKDGTWVDMSAAVTCTDLGTSYVAKTIKGYMDIQTGASLMPTEMRLIFQSNESDTDIVTSWSWANVTDLTSSNTCLSLAVFDDKIYAGGGSSVGYVYHSSGGGWTQETCTASSNVYGLAEFLTVLYAVTNARVYSESGGTWTSIGTSPNNCLSILVIDSTLYVGLEGGDVESTADGSTWVSTGLTGDGATGKVTCLAEHEETLYAGTDAGDVWRYVDSTWEQVGAVTLDQANVLSLAVLDDVLYCGTGTNGNVYSLNEAGDAWSNTGDLSGAVSARVLYVHDGVLFAATGNSGAVYAYDAGGNTWDPASVASELYIDSLVTYDGDLYCGSYNEGKVWKATITAESGEGIGKVKNDTVINIVGRFY